MDLEELEPGCYEAKSKTSYTVAVQSRGLGIKNRKHTFVNRSEVKNTFSAILCKDSKTEFFFPTLTQKWLNFVAL